MDPASSSLIHVVLQGSFCPNGVSGTIPSAQRDTENTPNGVTESHWFFLTLFSPRLISNLPSSGPISSLSLSSLLFSRPHPVSAPYILPLFFPLNSVCAYIIVHAFKSPCICVIYGNPDLVLCWITRHSINIHIETISCARCRAVSRITLPLCGVHECLCATPYITINTGLKGETLGDSLRFLCVAYYVQCIITV